MSSRGKYGIRATGKIGAIQREKHFKYGTPEIQKKIAAWQAECRVAIAKIPQRASGRGGTFGADVKTYLEQVKPTLAKATYDSRVCELDAYMARFKHVPRADIDRAALLEL